jgi:peptidoglycan/xylan/chitin deacetylase (PgdA/CDA1 family)
MRVPVLTYHAARISGNDYESNDHVAFHQDLRLMHSRGFKIAALSDIVKRLRSGDDTRRNEVALSFDDGTDFDFFDLPHPMWGTQRSMFNIMKDFIDEFGPDAQPKLHATSFVVASPDARRQLDRRCLADRNWYRDDWWEPAIASGLMSIANHSWDHNHPSVDVVAQRDQQKGTFDVIDTYEDANAQIHQATQFLLRKTNNLACRLFAYPYGQFNEYLTEQYLPNFKPEHGLEAAFTTVPDLLSASHDIWKLPRLVCGHDWKSSKELAAILTRVAVPFSGS